MSGKPKYVPEATIQKMINLRSQNMPLLNIAIEVGIPRERVRQILLRQGVQSKVPISQNYETYDHIDRRWMDEFRGFFLGEGCCTMYHNVSNPNSPEFRVDLHLAVRDDDAEIIHDIQNHLGGCVAKHKRDPHSSRSYPSIQWQMIGWRRLTNLLPYLLDGSLPGKKRRDIALMNELCQKRKTWPYNLSKEHIDELRSYYVAIQTIKRYQGSSG